MHITCNCDFLTLECDFQKKYEDYWFDDGKRTGKHEPTKPLMTQSDPPAKDFKINKADGGGKRAYNKKSAHWDNAKVARTLSLPLGTGDPAHALAPQTRLRSCLPWRPRWSWSRRRRRCGRKGEQPTCHIVTIVTILHFVGMAMLSASWVMARVCSNGRNHLSS